MSSVRQPGWRLLKGTHGSVSIALRAICATLAVGLAWPDLDRAYSALTCKELTTDELR